MVTAEQVPRIAPAFLAAERRALGRAGTDQEYGCRVLAAASTVFRPEDIARDDERRRRAAVPARRRPAPGEPLPLLLEGLVT